MRLRRLSIKNFRGLVNESVDFEPLTVVVGPNAAGKTTLLEAVRFLLSDRDQRGRRWDWLDVVSRDPHRPGDDEHPAVLAPDMPITVVGEFGEFSETEHGRFATYIDGDVLRLGARILPYDEGDGRRDAPFYVLRPTQVEAIVQPGDDSPVLDAVERPSLWNNDGWVWRPFVLGTEGLKDYLDSLRTGDPLPQVASLSGPDLGTPDFDQLLAPFVAAMIDSTLQRLGDDAIAELAAVAHGLAWDLGDRLRPIVPRYLGSGATVAIRRRQLSDPELLRQALRAIVGKLDLWVALRRSPLPEPWDEEEDELPPGSEPLSDMGAGVQRAVALAAMELYADSDLWPVSRPVILLIEEPEIGLHPAAQRRIAEALARLQHRSGIQTVVATHSPSIIRAASVDGIRMMPGTISSVRGRTAVTPTRDVREVAMAVGASPADLLLAETIMLVEGETDVELLRAWARRLGFVIEGGPYLFFPVGGHGAVHVVGRLVDLVFPGVRINVVLDSGRGPEEARDKIRRLYGERVDVALLPYREIEAAIPETAITRWLAAAGKDPSLGSGFSTWVERDEAKRGLSAIVWKAFGRSYGTSDAQAIGAHMSEAEIPPEVKSILVAALAPTTT